MNKSNFKHEYLFVLGNGASIASVDPKLDKLLGCTPSIENFVLLMERISQVNQKNPCELSERMDANNLEILINGYVQRVFEISKEKRETDIVKLLAILEEDVATNWNQKNDLLFQERTDRSMPIWNDISTLENAIYHLVAAYYRSYEEKYFEMVENGVSQKEALDNLNISRYCCRRMFLGHVNIIDKLLSFPKDIKTTQKNRK